MPLPSPSQAAGLCGAVHAVTIPSIPLRCAVTPLFTDEETEVQSSSVTGLRSPSWREVDCWPRRGCSRPPRTVWQQQGTHTRMCTPSQTGPRVPSLSFLRETFKPSLTGAKSGGEAVRGSPSYWKRGLDVGRVGPILFHSLLGCYFHEWWEKEPFHSPLLTQPQKG